MDEEQKLRLVKDAFIRKLDEISTWEDLKSFLGNITEAKIRIFIKSNLEQAAQGYRDGAIAGNAGADEIDALVVEVEDIT